LLALRAYLLTELGRVPTMTDVVNFLLDAQTQPKAKKPKI
jgi:hypothetical protein